MGVTSCIANCEASKRRQFANRSTFAKATVDTLFAFNPALPDGAFCEGG